MLELEPLDASHDRAGFDCGVDALNRYLCQVARQHQGKGISKTYVLVDARSTLPRPIAGYFTLTICEGRGQSLPPRWSKKLPAQIPAVRLGRLAVARGRQRQGVGELLVVAALMKVARVAAITGCVGLFVDAKDEAAADYYARFGFVPLVDAPLTLFLPIGTIVELLERRSGP